MSFGRNHVNSLIIFIAWLFIGYLLNLLPRSVSEAYYESSQRSKMKILARIINAFQPFTMFAKNLHVSIMTEF